MSILTGEYTKVSMIDEATFRHESDKALEALKQALIDAEEEGGFEAEEKNGVLNVLFEDGAAKFVFTPNTPVRQVWISALSTSFKLEWNEAGQAFILAKSGEDLRTLTERLLREQLDDPTITLKA
jgi:iron donor protein CyaY